MLRLAVFVLALAGALVLRAQDFSHGTVDLRGVELDARRTVALDGPWRFAWNRFVDPSAPDEALTDTIQVPEPWTHLNKEASFMRKALGRGTYRLRLRLPEPGAPYALKVPNIHTAYRMHINGQLVAACGELGNDARDAHPSSVPRVIGFVADSSGMAVINVQVSNHHFPTASGLWQPPRVGSLDAVSRDRSLGMLLNGFLLGSLLIMGLYHIGLYVMRKRDRGPLLFAVACFSLGYRELFAGEVAAFSLVPWLDWHVAMRSLILMLPISMLAILFFIRDLFTSVFSRGMAIVVGVVASFFALVVLVTPSTVYLTALGPFSLFALVMGIYGTVVLFRAMRRGMDGARLFFAGLLLLTVAVLNDTLLQVGVMHGYYLIPAGFFFFILSQSLVLAVRFTRSFFKVEELSDHLELTNRAYERFVPKQMLRLLNRDDITKVQLGEEKEGEMTVLFGDIVGFSTIAEKLTANETFKLINWTLGRTSGAIQRHGGFIDKYIGDAIMAIFPQEPASAVRAALEMRDSLREGMREQPFGPDINIAFGMGIHVGNMILGTVGDHERMEGTVISDAVNTAARVEGLTRKYNTAIIITEDVVDRLGHVPDLRINYLDETVVKGRAGTVRVYGVEWARD